MDAPPLLRRGDRLPDLAVVAPDGGIVRVGAFRQHRDLILLFLADAHEPAAPTLLAELGAHAAAVAAAPGALLPILLGSSDQAAALRTALATPFDILADPQARAHHEAGAVTAEGAATPPAYVVDRYGEVFFGQRLGPSGAPLTAADLVGWLDYIGLLCPE